MRWVWSIFLIVGMALSQWVSFSPSLDAPVPIISADTLEVLVTDTVYVLQADTVDVNIASFSDTVYVLQADTVLVEQTDTIDVNVTLFSDTAYVLQADTVLVEQTDTLDVNVALFSDTVYVEQATLPVSIDFDYFPLDTLADTTTFGAAWADLGGEIDCRGMTQVGIWLTLDINTDADLRLRALAKHTSGGSQEYYFTIGTTGTSNIAVEDEYIEFTNDADQLVFLQWDTNNIVPYIQFQIMAGTPGGGVHADVDASYVTYGYGD